MGSNKSSTIVILIVVMSFISQPCVRAEPEDLDVFTDFEDSSNTSQYTFGTSPNIITFTGNNGIRGTASIYRSGVKAFWIEFNDVDGRVEFESPASMVQFYAKDVGEGTNGVIRALNNQSSIISSAPLTSDWQLFTFIEFPELGPIYSLQLINDAQSLSQISAIDDFGFTPAEIIEPNEPNEPEPNIVTFSDVTRLTIKADKNRTTMSDAFTLSGTFTVNAEQVGAFDNIRVSLFPDSESGSFDEILPISNQDVTKNKISHKLQSENITSFQIDFNKGRFSLAAKNVDLTGFDSPLVLEIEFGNIFISNEINEMVINGPKKLIPTCLMTGVEDKLIVSKFSLKSNKKGDSLNIQGEIVSAETNVDFTQEIVTVQWGGFIENIPMGEFANKKGQKFTYKKPKTANGHVSKLDIDLDKCVFKCSIKDAPVLDKTGIITFSLSSSLSFDAQTEVQP